MGPYAGLSIPTLKAPYKFPKQVYQAKVIYFLAALVWHDGEEESLEALRIAAT